MTLHEAVEKHGSKRAAAKALGIPWTSFRRQYKAEKGLVPVSTPQIAKSSIEQQVIDAGFSMEDVSSAWIKSKEHSVQVKKRAQAVTLTDGFVESLEKARTHVVSRPQHESADCMLVVSLHDAHFAKLSYNRETGANYDLKIAATLYREAVWDALKFFNPARIKHIVFPIGSDLLHTDNMQGTTTSGTPVEATDNRFHHVFDTAMAAVIAGLEDCISIADVYAPVVPGNHDYCSSILLAKAVKQYFKGDSRIVIDDDEISRKYYHWGRNLLCFSHRFTKLDKAPVIMATEAPQQWANSVTREVMTGHTHRQHASQYSHYTEISGVIVRVLPSLSATDRWHYDNGFIGNLRAAESHLYSETEGYIGSHISKARM